MMLDFHNFWTELFPVFQNGYQFVYVFFDIASIIFFIDLILTVPKFLFLGSKKFL